MKIHNRHFPLLSAITVALLPILVSAHQPRLVSSEPVIVADPEISKAYYGKLTGEPHIYRINAKEPFAIYVNLLAPDITGQKRDVSAAIIQDGKMEPPIAVLAGETFDWTRYWEQFGRDWYWKGPEYRARAEAGDYEIRVWSTNNDSKYALAIGEIEMFDGKEAMNAIRLIPKIKRDFFETSPIGFILSPFGYGYVIIVYLFAFLIGFLYRQALRKFFKKTPRGASRNIARKGRIARFVAGMGLLVLAIATTWNPLLLFLSGFTVFEALFSWCGYLAAVGKSECPVE